MKNQRCLRCGKELTKDQISRKCKYCCPNCATQHYNYDQYFLHNHTPFRAWLLGYFVADGCLTGNHLAFCTTDKELIELIRYKIIKTGSIHTKERKYANQNATHELQLTHKNSVRLGQYMYEKNSYFLKRKYDVWRNGCNLVVRKRNQGGKCSIKWCRKPYLAQGYCAYHYGQLQEVRNKKKLWASNNLDKIKAAQKRYYLKNKEKRNKNSREWRLKNIEKCRQREREYAHAHQAQRTAYMRKWIATKWPTLPEDASST